MRMTLARGVNMENIKSYAKLVEKACPTYVEPKAYMHVGFSRLRLNFENMPSHEEIREFAAQLAKETSYSVLDEAEESRVVLLSKLEKPRRLGNC
jgi:tRNA wybutosine-synthesizing protein 1